MTEITINIPEIVPLYPLREMVAFPYMVFPLYLNGAELATFEESMMFSNMVALVKLRGEPAGDIFSSLHEIGTVCKVNQLQKLPDGGTKAVLEGITRIRLEAVIQETPIILARIEPVREFVEKSMVSEASSIACDQV